MKFWDNFVWNYSEILYQFFVNFPPKRLFLAPTTLTRGTGWRRLPPKWERSSWAHSQIPTAITNTPHARAHGDTSHNPPLTKLIRNPLCSADSGIKIKLKVIFSHCVGFQDTKNKHSNHGHRVAEEVAKSKREEVPVPTPPNLSVSTVLSVVLISMALTFVIKR